MKMLKTGICAALLVLAKGQGEEPMKMINAKNGLVIVEFREEGPVFNDPILEAHMRERGIAIPPPLQEKFGGKKRVLADDPEFQEAFTEVYFKYFISDKDLFKIIM